MKKFLLLVFAAMVLVFPAADAQAKSSWVKSHYRKNGTYIHAHMRTPRITGTYHSRVHHPRRKRR